VGRARPDTPLLPKRFVMAGYCTILARAIGALEPNTATARRQLYDRARAVMISTLETAKPPFAGAEVAAAKIAFESAVVRVEAAAVQRNSVVAVGNEAPPLSPDRQPVSVRLRVESVPVRDTWLTDLLKRASVSADDGKSFAPRVPEANG
jgi:hypothetical protein